jgi:hypothetical protein
MTIFVFNSGRDPDVVGFTRSQNGANLPPQYAPWHPAADGGAVMLGGDTDASTVMAGIRREGFYLAVGGYEEEGPISEARH